MFTALFDTKNISKNVNLTFCKQKLTYNALIAVIFIFLLLIKRSIYFQICQIILQVRLYLNRIHLQKNLANLQINASFN